MPDIFFVCVIAFLIRMSTSIEEEVASRLPSPTAGPQVASSSTIISTSASPGVPVSEHLVGVSSVVGFYVYGAPDDRGRTLDMMLDWPDEKLERLHDYIQVCP